MSEIAKPGHLQGLRPEVETVTPTRAADLVADLLVPLGQAVVTGVLLAALAVFLLGELAPKLDIDTLKLWAGLALAIAAVAWLVLLGQTRRLLWTVEKLTGLDLDRDGTSGTPKPAERVVIVNAGQAKQEADQRERADRVSSFARFVSGLETRGTSMGAWESDLGRDTYQDYRDALLRLGWARWKSVKQDGTANERQGWVLTLPAAEILRRVGS